MATNVRSNPAGSLAAELELAQELLRNIDDEITKDDSELAVFRRNRRQQLDTPTKEEYHHHHDESHEKRRREDAFTSSGRLDPRFTRPQDSVEDKDFTQNRRRLGSGIVSSGKEKSRDEVLSEQRQNRSGMERGRRFFGALAGTLKQFQQDETKLNVQEDKRAQIKSKLDEAAEQEREAKNLTNFIQTEVKPHIFSMPKTMTPIMECRIEKSKQNVTGFDMEDDKKDLVKGVGFYRLINRLRELEILRDDYANLKLDNREVEEDTRTCEMRIENIKIETQDYYDQFENCRSPPPADTYFEDTLDMKFTITGVDHQLDHYPSLDPPDDVFEDTDNLKLTTADDQQESYPTPDPDNAPEETDTVELATNVDQLENCSSPADVDVIDHINDNRMLISATSLMNNDEDEENTEIVLRNNYNHLVLPSHPTDDGFQQNSVVLKLLLKYLDQKTLGIFRRVCKTWNEIVIPFYSDQYWITFGLYNKPFSSTASRLTRIKELEEVMFSAPKGLVTKLKVNYELIRIKPIQEWFKEFGPYLTSLRICGPFNEYQVFRILVTCTNLIRFELIILHHHPTDTAPTRFQAIFPQMLNLKIVGFYGFVENEGINLQYNHDYILQDTQVPFLIDIVAASKSLETLRLYFGDDRNSFHQFILGIQPYVDVTGNITEWHFGGHELMTPLIRHMSGLESILFSKKVKLLHLHDFRDTFTISSVGFISTSLERILYKVRKSLECLLLSGQYVAITPNTNVGLLLQFQQSINLPFMKSLTEFGNWSIQSFKLLDLSFVKQFPNLRKLTLDAEPVEYFQAVLFDPSSIALAYQPHTNLENLLLMKGLAHPFQLQVVVKAFPNLRVLNFALEKGFPGSDQVSTALRVLHQLNNLEELTIEFLTTYHPNQLDKALKDAFEPLNLKSLTLIGNHYPADKMKGGVSGQLILLSTIAGKILGAKKLKTLRLQYFVMKLFEAAELREIVQDRGIQLHYV